MFWFNLQIKLRFWKRNLKSLVAKALGIHLCPVCSKFSKDWIHDGMCYDVFLEAEEEASISDAHSLNQALQEEYDRNNPPEEDDPFGKGENF